MQGGGGRGIERERGKRRGTGAKWKGHTYKVRLQRHGPNQIASREREARQGTGHGNGESLRSVCGNEGGRREESGVTQEQERQPEQSSGSDGIEPGTLGKG